MEREPQNEVKIDINGIDNEKTKQFRDPPITYDKVYEMGLKNKIIKKKNNFF